MSQAPILALTLFTLLNAVAYFWYQSNRYRIDGRQERFDRTLNPADTSFNERRVASSINRPGARTRLNDHVARLLAILAATSFGIAIASRYLSGW
jgi:hypothetical protein